jgi:hypothetical protein
VLRQPRRDRRIVTVPQAGSSEKRHGTVWHGAKCRRTTRGAARAMTTDFYPAAGWFVSGVKAEMAGTRPRLDPRGELDKAAPGPPPRASEVATRRGKSPKVRGFRRDSQERGRHGVGCVVGRPRRRAGEALENAARRSCQPAAAIHPARSLTARRRANEAAAGPEKHNAALAEYNR